MEVLAQFIGNGIALALGWLLHRQLDWPPKRAVLVGEWTVYAVLIGAGLAVTLIYS